MSGDWIKMRGNLWDDPRVSHIVDRTDSSEAAVVGALYWLWSTADQHTEDGVMPGLTIKAIDRKTGVPGFAEALCAVGWLADHPEGVRIVKFEEHNGASAKSRCQTAKRVSEHKANAKVTQAALPEQHPTVTTALPREEKRREEKNTNTVDQPDGFESFWRAYPKKVGKPAALKAFRSAKINGHLPEVLADIGDKANTDAWTKDGGQFVPNPATYLNQRRWEDEKPTAPNPFAGAI